VTVVNDSPLALATVPPHPVRVGARWIRSDDRNLFRRGPMSALPRLLHADDRVEVEVLLVAPDEPGRYELRLALHQTGRGWFGRRTSGEVVVEAAAEEPEEPDGPEDAAEPVEPESAPAGGQPLGSVMRP